MLNVKSQKDTVKVHAQPEARKLKVCYIFTHAVFIVNSG
jgi:hypothetical protein